MSADVAATAVNHVISNEGRGRTDSETPKSQRNDIDAGWPQRPVPLKDITIDEDVQARFKLDEVLVERFASFYREDLESGIPRLPPVILIETPEGKLILADGFTRIAAAKRIELRSVLATVRPGTKRDAIMTGIQRNSTHGSPLTLAERRRAVERLFSDPAWAKESDRELGRRCGLDCKTVSKVRCKMAPTSTGETRTVRRAGKVFQMQVLTARRSPPAVTIQVDAPIEPVSVATTSAEIPQMTSAPKKRRFSKGKPNTRLPKPMSFAATAATSARDEQNLRQLLDLHRRWDELNVLLGGFIDLLDTANPLVRVRFLKDTPAAARLTPLLSDRREGSECTGKSGPKEDSGT